MPPPLKIPPNASPQLQAYLTAQDQLSRDRIRVMNRYRMAAPQIQKAALQQWQRQNADRINQLRHLAQALPQPDIPKESSLAK